VVVCPNCRNVNEEGATNCAKCGNSLEPGYMALVSVRRTEEERPPIEVRQPTPPSKWRPFVVLGVFLLAAAAAGTAWLLRPDPCEGTNFQSENFGYCILVPEGWEAGPAQFGSTVTLDQFAPPTEAATVVVEAVDLESGTDLADWSQFVRQRDEDAGLTPGAPSEATLDGVDALQWDVSVTAEGGESFHMREVVAVRDDVGWRITLNDIADGFATSAFVFDSMLDSWQFR
jgi:hypothetical protein